MAQLEVDKLINQTFTPPISAVGSQGHTKYIPNRYPNACNYVPGFGQVGFESGMLGRVLNFTQKQNYRNEMGIHGLVKSEDKCLSFIRDVEYEGEFGKTALAVFAAQTFNKDNPNVQYGFEMSNNLCSDEMSCYDMISFLPMMFRDKMKLDVKAHLAMYPTQVGNQNLPLFHLYNRLPLVIETHDNNPLSTFVEYTYTFPLKRIVKNLIAIKTGIRLAAKSLENYYGEVVQDSNACAFLGLSVLPQFVTSCDEIVFYVTTLKTNFTHFYTTTPLAMIVMRKLYTIIPYPKNLLIAEEGEITEQRKTSCLCVLRNQPETTLGT